MSTQWQPGPDSPPWEALGGREGIAALVEHFYDEMSRSEPALAALHRLDERGLVDRGSRDRFALFLVAGGAVGAGERGEEVEVQVHGAGAYATVGGC